MTTKENYKLYKEYSVDKGFYFDEDKRNRLIFYSDGTVELTCLNTLLKRHYYTRTVWDWDEFGNQAKYKQEDEDNVFLKHLDDFLLHAPEKYNGLLVHITEKEYFEICDYLLTLPWVVDAVKRIVKEVGGYYPLIYSLYYAQKKLEINKDAKENTSNNDFYTIYNALKSNNTSIKITYLKDDDVIEVEDPKTNKHIRFNFLNGNILSIYSAE